MENEEIEDWLTEIGKDRKWLAERLGLKKGTLDNQFSKGFTARTLSQIKELRQPSTPQADYELVFTDTEFDMIQEACKIAGYHKRRDFYRDAITEGARRIVKANITPFPGEDDSRKVAEDERGLGS